MVMLNVEQLLLPGFGCKCFNHYFSINIYNDFNNLNS